MAGSRTTSQQSRPLKKAKKRQRKTDSPSALRYDREHVSALLKLLSKRSDIERTKLAKRLGVTVDIVREWEADLLSNLTPLEWFDSAQRDVVASVRLFRHLEEALNAAAEGARWGTPIGRATSGAAALVLQALIGSVGSSAQARRALEAQRRVAVSTIDVVMRDRLVVPGDHRGVLLAANQWSSRKNEILDVIQDALDKHPIAKRSIDGGNLGLRQVAAICAAPMKHLDRLGRAGDSGLIEIASDIAIDIRVGLATRPTAIDGLGELAKQDMLALQALVAEALHRGAATAQQLGRALVSLLGVPKFKNFFDARAVRAWRKHRAAVRREG